MKRFSWLFFLVCEIFAQSKNANVLQFTDGRSEGTSTRLVNGPSGGTKDLTLCVDFKISQVKYNRVLQTEGGTDLIVEVPDSLDRFYIVVKGIWYLTPAVIVPYEWGTFCLSYESASHRLAFAYKGVLMLAKEDPVIHATTEFSPNLPEKLMLGPKGDGHTFAGEIARLGVWKSAMEPTLLVRETNHCETQSPGPNRSGPLDYSAPDFIHWETTRWNGVHMDNVLKTYPCLKTDVELTEVVMPYESDSVEEAHSVCGRLGGILRPPKSKEDMEELLRLADRENEKSDCSGYLWVPYQVNQVFYI